VSNPTPSDLHANIPLTQISLAYGNKGRQYFADKVFPNVPVQKMSDIYWTYPKGDFFRTDVQKRARGSESVGTGWRVSQAQYFAEIWSAHKDIADVDRANADNEFALDSQATRFLTNQALLRRDKQFVSKYFTTSVWDTDLTGVDASPTGGQFLRFNVGGSDPIGVIEAKRIDMAESTGEIPNTLLVGPRVHSIFKNHPQILDRIKWTQRGQITNELLASMFEVERYMVAYTTNNTANEAQTASMSFLAGKHMLLCHSAPEPGREIPSAGYTFSWNGYMGATALGSKISRFRMEAKRSDRVEIEMAFDLKTVATDLGVFFSTAVA
jgi:hypothetical protein